MPRRNGDGEDTLYVAVACGVVFTADGGQQWLDPGDPVLRSEIRGEVDTRWLLPWPGDGDRSLSAETPAEIRRRTATTNSDQSK